MIFVTSSFLKRSVFKMLSVHTKTKSQRFQIPQVFKSVFEKFCFHDGLVWTIGPNRRNKAVFLNLSGAVIISFAAFMRVVTQKREALRDDPNNGCEGDERSKDAV